MLSMPRNDRRALRIPSLRAPSAGVLAVVLCAGGVVSPVTPLLEPAYAQAAERYVAPVADGVQMRCNPGSAWYSVATLDSGTVLSVIRTTSEGWLEVAYPAGTRAVVKDEEVQVDQATRTATLTRRSRLRAFSPANPVLDECFKAIFDDFLEPGTTLRVEGRIQNLEGKPSGYVVVAPAGATGYVLASEVRDATPDEVSAFRASGAAIASAPAAATPAPSRPADSGAVQLSDAADAPAQAETESAPVSGELTMGQTGQQESLPGSMPAEQQPAPAQTQITEAQPSPVLPAPRPQSGPSLNQLDAAFARMQRQPVASTDPTELIEQFERYAQQLMDDGAPQRSIDYVDARIQVLRLREELRMTGVRIDQLATRVDGVQETYEQTLARLANGREYLVVGRLMPSSLYDGERMPLLYRLTSIDATAPRTLAYVTPQPGMELDSKTGAIVGVVGDSGPDTNPSVSIVRPTKIDILQAASASRPMTADAEQSEPE